MILLYRYEDDEPVGSIGSEDLQLLADNLEEEDTEDTDYCINRDTIEFLRSRGASPALLMALEKALGNAEDVEIYYESGDQAGDDAVR